MYLLGKATTGLLVALTTLTACSTTTTSPSSEQPLQPGRRAQPVARVGPDALAATDSCADLLRAYVRDGVRNTGPYGWSDQVHGWEDTVRTLDAVGAVGPYADVRGAAAGSATGTNTQEAAVDEPDVAKTDGHLVVRIVDDQRLVLVDVSGSEPRVTRRLRLPRNGYQSELLLIGDRVLITQQTFLRQHRSAGHVPFGLERAGTAAVRVLLVDIADPSAPRLLRTDLYSGTETGLRQYGGTVRLVTGTGRPELRWVHPRKGLSVAAATRQNRALVRATTIGDWLPWVRHDGTRSALLGCDQVLRSPEPVLGQTLTVTTLDVGTEHRTSVGVTGPAPVVYSSTDRLYVASSDLAGQRVLHGPATGGAVGPTTTTRLHAFALDGGTTTYLGSGHVAGTVRDRWSLDEHDRRLRVVSTRSGRRGTVSQVTVLGERDGALVRTGRVTGLGRDESLRAVRWFDDLAVLVTFRQVDPLITVDLRDPGHPRPLGTLEVPGYSGYLHPLGDHLLLGLGADVSGDGSDRGAQAAVFDIGRPAHPVRLSQVRFGPDTWLSAQDDPRGFTWVPDARTGVTSLQDWEGGGANLVALRVGPAGRLRTQTLLHLNEDWQGRTLALPGGRVAVLDHHRVRVVAVG